MGGHAGGTLLVTVVYLQLVSGQSFARVELRRALLSEQNERDTIAPMFRHALILATAFVFLICPIRCVSASAPSGPGAAVAKKCACCRNARPVTNDAKQQAPQPADSCECGNCLCHGALLVAGVDTVDIGPVCPVILLPLSLVECTPVWRPDFGVADGHFDFKRSDGRSTRVACASWLC